MGLGLIRNGKIDLTPRRHHGFAVVLFFFGMLFPPLAVAARFGIGKDFWLNLVLTICGYIPGHGHNFYIQNIRNNSNRRRMPKWVAKYGLADTYEMERRKKRSEWAARYNDRLPHSVFEGQEYAEGEVPDPPSRENSILDPESRARRERLQQEGLWNEEEERYYGQRERGRGNGSLDSGSISTSGGGSSSRWHYPANFEDTLPGSETSLDGGLGGKKKKKKTKAKKDRWAMTEDAYNAPPGSALTKKRKSKKTKLKNHSTVGGVDQDGVEDYDRRRRSELSLDDGPGFPEDPEGGLYGERRKTTVDGVGNGHAGNGVPDVPSVRPDGRKRDELDHEF